MAHVTEGFTPSSVAASLALTLPPLMLADGSIYGGTVAFPVPSSIPNDLIISEVVANTSLVTGVPAVQSAQRTPLLYFEIATNLGIGFSRAPSFALTVPATQIVSQTAFYLAAYDLLRPALTCKSGTPPAGTVASGTFTVNTGLTASAGSGSVTAAELATIPGVTYPTTSGQALAMTLPVNAFPTYICTTAMQKAAWFTTAGSGTVTVPSDWKTPNRIVAAGGGQFGGLLSVGGGAVITGTGIAGGSGGFYSLLVSPGAGGGAGGGNGFEWGVFGSGGRGGGGINGGGNGASGLIVLIYSP